MTVFTGILSINEERLYSKVTWRLVPFLFVFYVLGYLDRVNISFAKLQMLSDLGWSDSVYGTGAGMFFIGYFVLQVPGNIIMTKVGARRWIATIMMIWGLISASMMFVHTTTLFYTLRFALGLAEAGFFPGIVYYFSLWFPSQRRGKVIAMFFSAIAVAGIIGGPLSGWIMHTFDHVGGLKGWQWLFVMEGLPTVILGSLVLVVLNDSIQEVGWLTNEEKTLLASNLANDARPNQHYKLGAVLTDGKIWLLCAVGFMGAFGIYSINFWLPQVIKDTGVADPLYVGLLSAIPYAVSIPVMLAVCAHSDRTGERRWHIALSYFTTSVGLAGCALAGHSTLWSMVALTVGTSGFMAYSPIFWTMPAEFLSGAGLAAAIGLISSTGNLGGFFSPYIMGYIRDTTHNAAPGFYLSAAILAMAGIIVLARERRKKGQ